MPNLANKSAAFKATLVPKYQVLTPGIKAGTIFTAALSNDLPVD